MSPLPQGAPTEEALFLDTMEDLRQRSDLRATQYDMTQSAGLVRRLITDGKPLYQSVRSKLAAPEPTFHVGNMWVGLETGAGLAWVQGPWLDAELAELDHRRIQMQAGAAGQDPSDLDAPTSTVLDLPGFLAHEAVGLSAVDGRAQSASVKEIIRLYAHLLGGVHVDMEKAANPLLLAVMTDNEPFLRETMNAIGRTVHRALEPLAHLAVLSGRPRPFGLDIDISSGPHGQG